MATLNDRTQKTQGVIHLMVTTMCARDCPYCCNKQYDLNEVPLATDEELDNAHTVFITGGEPFQFTDPCNIAETLKFKHPNIEKVIVYTNAIEYAIWSSRNELHSIDGVNVSIKNSTDLEFFERCIANDSQTLGLKNNRLYLFDVTLMPKYLNGFELIHRKWQEEFEPAEDSIFRRI